MGGALSLLYDAVNFEHDLCAVCQSQYIILMNFLIHTLGSHFSVFIVFLRKVFIITVQLPADSFI
jgi:hypothetical protein